LCAWSARLSPGRLPFPHDHHACDFVLGVKHEAVIQIGEDAFQAFLNGQVIKGHRNLLLEQGFISPEPNARLLLDVSRHFQKGIVLEIHGEQTILDGDKICSKNPCEEEQTESRKKE